MIDDSFYSDYIGINDQPENEGRSPERCLMAGMLSRAYFDLISNGDDPGDRRSAIKWFQRNDTKYIFSYFNVKLHLNISRKLQKHIDMILRRAIKLDEEERYVSKQSEGQTCGTCPRKLDEGPGYSFCQTLPAVLG